MGKTIALGMLLGSLAFSHAFVVHHSPFQKNSAYRRLGWANAEPDSNINNVSTDIDAPVEIDVPVSEAVPVEKKPPVRRPVPELGDPASDIVQLVKPRSDWWDEGPLASPARDVAKTDSESPFDKAILATPIPAYGFLGITGVVAIACVGSLFQLFYDSPPAPVLGVPATALVLALSGPTWVITFIAAIKKGQAEADAEDGGRY
mmetsp:Transcript_74437/g.145414  ORF Transcript_74437/g.145414 Transcript_74437/m.145414 type:complete len:204 (+) Transcript_74437:41-652(+)